MRCSRRRLLCAFGLFRPTTPELVIIATLLVSGCCRSLQFTSLNAISYADVDSKRMGQASSLSGMLQQLALSLGVAIGGYSLEIFGALADRPGDGAAELLLGVRRRRVDLGELCVVGVAVAAPRRSRDGGARARRAAADPSTAELPAG